MRFFDGRLVHTPSDLTGFLECGHLTGLERAAAEGRLARTQRDAATDLLAGKGLAHELRYRDGLHAEGGDLADLSALDGSPESLTRATREAMARGADVIYQATLFDGEWLGRADFLLRVETPSREHAWSYEVADTKLALSARASAIVQLAAYSEMLERLQGVKPQAMHLVLGSGERISYPVHSFAAYVRALGRDYLLAIESETQPYPLPVPYCAQCAWNDGCADQRAHDDHLSLVANLRRDHVKHLEAHGIVTMTALAQCESGSGPRGIAYATFERLRQQAHLQHTARVAARESGKPVYRYALLEPKPHAGFALLPPPSPGDIFFDMEGDPLYEARRGLEYLFGNTFSDGTYKAFWGYDREGERLAFEQCIDLFIEARRRDPSMHVYHYAPYEKSAMRRLSTWFETREHEVISLLDDGVLIDLYAVVRGAVMVSQPSYSIKKLEPFYGFTRDTDVKAGDDSVVAFETWLVNREQTALLEDIERYNAADCESTRQLRLWLDQLKSEAEGNYGVAIAFDPPNFHEADAEASGSPEESADDEKKFEQARKKEARRIRLKAAQASAAEADRLLAGLLGYYHRERKPALREFYERCENADHLLEDDSKAIGGVKLDPSIEPLAPSGKSKAWTYTFTYPPQRCEPDTGAWVDAHTRQAAGTMLDWSPNQDGGGSFRLRLSAKTEGPEMLRSLVRKDLVLNEAHEDRLADLAEALATGTLPPRHVGRDLLNAAVPVFSSPPSGGIVQPAQADGAAIAELASALAASYLVVQGPPGTGKTTVGADAIVRLLEQGLRVGITARSHAAIDNLLARVDRVALARNVAYRGVRKVASGDDDGDDGKSTLISSSDGRIVAFNDRKHKDRVHEFNLLAGTSWFFAAPYMRDAVDVLFVDEAGQLPLADALAISFAAHNMVLLGDPLQLRQVVQGTHEAQHEGAGSSALEHLLGDHRTVPPERGVFLDRSYRMHPEICTFISEMIYDGRLAAWESMRANAVASEKLSGYGLRFMPCEHQGNSRDSHEEAQVIVEYASALLQGTVTIGDAAPRRLGMRDILVVTPYNAQRRLIERMLTRAGIGDIRVGTVDKFQGQEAPVVFYSMATSSQDDLPRDIAFLFEANRFNVAISRAQALCIVVASPALLRTRCRTAEEMAMVNLLCRYVECATPIFNEAATALRTR